MTLKTSKSFTNVHQTFKPLFILMLICGVNLTFNRKIFSKIASRIYSVLLLITISYATMTCCPSQEISFIWSLLEYSVYVIFMMFYDSRFPIYIQKALKLDTFLRINSRQYKQLRTKMCIFIGIMFLIRSLYMIVYCLLYVCYTSVYLFVIYEFSMLALDINRIWRYFLFEQVWYRLSVLRKRIVENPAEHYYLYVSNNKMFKENKIRFGLYLYRKIADLLDLISTEQNASLLMGVVCSIPKLIINAYRILLVIDHAIPCETVGIMLFNIFQTFIFIVSPCAVIEMYQAEVEKIKLFLMHKYISETNAETKADIQVFLQYMDIRNFRYKVWRMFSMDMQLPLQLMNFCTTYVIVVVNFTEVFE